MPRNRLIRCDYWVNEQVLACSLNARLLFIGLWNFCDDHGVHPASYLTLKAEVFPVDSITIEETKKLIKELINNHLISEYTVEGIGYWRVTGWKNLQKIDKPTYRYPLPESDLKSIHVSQKPKVLDNNTQNNPLVLEEQSASPQVLLDDVSSNSSVAFDANEMKRKEKEKEIHIGEVETSLVSDSSCTEVFQHWQSTMKHPNAKFDRKRKRIIKQALEMGYSTEQLKQAIDGCNNTPFNMGQNERNQVYDDIALILRDAEHIERFASKMNKPTVEQLNTVANGIMVGVI